MAPFGAYLIEASMCTFSPALSRLNCRSGSLSARDGPAAHPALCTGIAPAQRPLRTNSPAI